MNFVEYPDREALVLDLVDVLAEELVGALHHEDRAALAVPGGTTPGPVFDALCAVDLDWARVDVVLTDERWLPADHERSNTRLLRERLFQGRAAAANLVPLYTATDTPEEGLGALEGGIRAITPLSVVLLGMGTDKHTASIFPGADKLDAALSPNAPPLVAMRAPGAPEPRVTLSEPVLNGALSKHLLIFGPDKRTALEQAQGARAHDAPIAAFLRDLTVHWAV
ncbi:6-phosphogluconolactonase [Aliiroseovarius subalbicans]|uniref:6-phosphogluconolactonase n=1 Tax=Aliiroseovarius subalbicans TaxID=2925840 RepID=UPI001F589A70|nr:6-phosphogluconolactonase [Aliiroseovarius subalbicans]MCI2398446.1 6-phosphogluconolactonase [Aliiroseovarius subalbicans]